MLQRRLGLSSDGQYARLGLGQLACRPSIAGRSSGESGSAIFHAFFFFRFQHEFLPEAGDSVELGYCAASCAKGAAQGGLFLDQRGVLHFECFFLRLALAVQDGQAELQVADLAIVGLALLLHMGVCSFEGSELLCLGRFGVGFGLRRVSDLSERGFFGARCLQSDGRLNVNLTVSLYAPSGSSSENSFERSTSGRHMTTIAA